MRLFFGWFVITSVVDNRFEVQKNLSFSYKKKKKSRSKIIVVIFF